MEFVPAGADDDRQWAPTCRLWRGLPSIPRVVVAIPGKGAPLLLRYAAIDWLHQPIKIKRNEQAAAQLAGWGVELTQVFDILKAYVPEAELGWLASPMIKFDLRGALRVLFLPPTFSARHMRALPPEAARDWPRVGEAALVHVVGRVMSRQLVRDRRIVAKSIASIITRCLEPDPVARFRSLRELRAALETVAGGLGTGYSSTVELAWEQIEAAIGLLALGKPVQALVLLDAAHRIEPNMLGSAQARAKAYALGAKPDDPYRRLQPMVAHGRQLHAAALRDQLAQPNIAPPHRGEEPRLEVPWSRARELGASREAERDFEGALALYHHVRRESTNRAALDLAKARCYLNLGRAGLAAEHAGEALDDDRFNSEAYAIRTRALFLDRQYNAALASADEWIDVAPADGHARYLRGRCLFVLGRILEARDSLDRASSLQPQLLEAQLLRREVERSIATARRAAGVQSPIELAIPEQLSSLGAVLANGHVGAGIEILRRAEYLADPVAQLLLAALVTFDGGHHEAVEIFARIADISSHHRHVALVGMARALVALGRHADALTVLDGLCAARPEDTDASDARAETLRQLGREQEAEAELGRLVSLIESRSDLRVRDAKNRLL